MSAETAPFRIRIESDRREESVVDVTAASVVDLGACDASRTASGASRSASAVDPETETTAVDPETVATAVLEGSAGRVTVDAPDPGPAYEHVRCVRPSMAVRSRTALASAARSRGATAPQDDEIRALREEIADLAAPSTPDLAAARRRLAGTETAVDRLRERVAALRGRVQAGREASRDVSDLEEDLADAARELSERETERAAAREALDRARREARQARDARERRRRLEDRLANLERRARSVLVDRWRDAFATAVAECPEPTTDADAVSVAPESDPFAVDDVTAALAIGRVADLRAPVVLACGRFETADAAAEWLDAPVIRL